MWINMGMGTPGHLLRQLVPEIWYILQRKVFELRNIISGAVAAVATPYERRPPRQVRWLVGRRRRRRDDDDDANQP